MMKEKLRIGILLNSHIIPSWEFQIVKVIENSEYAEIVLVILNSQVATNPQKKRNLQAPRLLRLLDKTDRIIFRRKIDYDLKKDVYDLLRDIPQLELENGHEESSANISGPEVNRISKYGLDIILKFGSFSINSDILKKAKYGILSYSVDNQKILNEIEPGFWEVVRKADVTNSALVISDGDNEQEAVIFSSWESTCPFSINSNRNIVHWRNALFMPRIVKGIYKNGKHFLDRQKDKFNSVAGNTETNPLPSSFYSSSWDILNYCTNSFRTIYRKLFYTDDFNWQLLFNIHQGDDGLVPDFSKFTKISSPKGTFWADPFIVAEDDNYYVFVEEFIYKKHKAHISVLKLDNKGTLLRSDKIIERQYHMSYPFVFKMDDVYYMIPETSRSKNIELYRCTDFPYKWKFERNLMENISAVDTTLFLYNKKWWLFTSVDQTGNISGNSTELFLFFTDNIFSGKWENHPDNPIVSDVRRARPAGKLFIHDDKIYRPSQDCSGRYGKAFNINQVTKLTETEYSETLHTKIEPLWDKKLAGIHTFNYDKDFTIIDVYSFRKRIRVW
jgi:hypothetical protein